MNNIGNEDIKHTLIIGTTGRGKSYFLQEEADRLGIPYDDLVKRMEPISDKKENEEDVTLISVNIWDDFYDDEHVPDGEIQETYAYIEEDNLSYDTEKECLAILMKHVEKTALFPNENMELSFYDSAKVYPNLVGTEHEYCLYKRWQIQFKNITHSTLDSLVEKLNNADLHHNGIALGIYSES